MVFTSRRNQILATQKSQKSNIGNTQVAEIKYWQFRYSPVRKKTNLLSYSKLESRNTGRIRPDRPQNKHRKKKTPPWMQSNIAEREREVGYLERRGSGGVDRSAAYPGAPPAGGTPRS